MSIETQINEPKTKNRNAVYDRALSIDEKIKPSETTDENLIKLTAIQKEKLEQLIDFLGIARGTAVNIVINSAISLVKLQNTELEKLDNYPKQLGTEDVQFILSKGTSISIETANLSNKLTECAIIGIEYLHEKLLSELLENQSKT
jgi:hypothetical protein